MRDQAHPEDRGALLAHGALHLSHDAAISLSAHHFWKLLIPLDGHVGVSLPSGQQWVSTSALLVQAHLLHRAWSTGSCLALLQDSTSLDGTRHHPQNQTNEGVTTLQGTLAATLRDIARRGQHDLGEALADELHRCVAPFWVKHNLDPRIARVQVMLETGEPCAVEPLAAHVNLSRGHLAHLFKQDMGLTMPRYLLWRRTLRALGLVLQGQGLIDAAYEAGFADQAHFSRSFRRLLGRSPSALFMPPNRRIVQDRG